MTRYNYKKRKLLLYRDFANNKRGRMDDVGVITQDNYYLLAATHIRNGFVAL